LDLDNDSGFSELFLEALIFAAELAVLFLERVTFRFPPSLPRCQALMDAFSALTPPVDQVRREETLAAEQGSHGPRFGGGVRFGQDALLVLGRESSPLCSGDDFRIWSSAGPRFGSGFA